MINYKFRSHAWAYHFRNEMKLCWEWLMLTLIDDAQQFNEPDDLGI